LILRERSWINGWKNEHDRKNEHDPAVMYWFNKIISANMKAINCNRENWTALESINWVKRWCHESNEDWPEVIFDRKNAPP
jgi:esterase/lipase superfamily enzyme